MKNKKCGCFFTGAVQLCALHAAAPVMLAALKEAKFAIEDMTEGSCLVSIVNAIKKAEGR